MKKACNRPETCLILYYRQVTCTYNKYGTAHAYKRKPSRNLFSYIECLPVFRIREQELKAQYPKSIERKR